ncbi:MAG TPA: DUF5696 domain-containing protein [Bacillota bacterium]|nr:DUF5696 domain-containing protein [Bacillota bacterium]
MRTKIALFLSLCILLLIPAGFISSNAETDMLQTDEVADEVTDSSTGLENPVEETNEYASTMDRLGAMEMISESHGSKLYFDPKTCDIAVTNEGVALFSTPYDLSSDSRSSKDFKTAIASQIRLEYLDPEMTRGELLSLKDCISLDQFTTEYIDDGIQVNMVLGREEQRLLLPLALPADSFETGILAQLEGRAVTRMNAFYKKYDPQETSAAQIEAIKERYPLAEDEAIYVLLTVTDRERKEIEGYIRATDYTFEQMETDIERTGAREDELNNPYFKLSIQYQLDQGDLLVTLPTDTIEFDRSKFQLTHIGILEYFGSEPIENDGYVFIPDGSGSIIKFNKNMQKDGGFISLPVYGYDRSISYTAANDTKANVRLPIFGVKSQGQAFLAILEEGAGLAKINASSGGVMSNYAVANATFAYSDSDSFTYKDIGKQYAWTLADSNPYTGDYQIRYKLLDGKDANYSGMATTYRQHLISQGELLPRNEETSALPLYLGMYGTVKHQERFFGFPINKNIALTTFDDAYLISKELTDNGIQNQKIRYLAWANGGMDYSAFNRVNVERVLGGPKKLKELNEMLEEIDTDLFMDADLAYVSRDKWFDGFSPHTHTSRMLDKTYAGLRRPDMASGLMDNSTFKFVLNPRVMKSFAESFANQYKNLGITGLSVGSIGRDLNSDKDEKRGVNRDCAQDHTKEIFEDLAQSHEIMTEGGNSYSYPYASHIIALDSESSGYPDTDYSVPFVQMVLHGSSSYSSTPINLSGDPETELLKAVENGAGLYFELVYQNANKLKNTGYRNLYSVDYHTWSDTIVNYYNRANTVLADLTNETITRHEYIEEGVPVVTYSSGAKIVVNYTDEDITVDGENVESRSFRRLDR